MTDSRIETVVVLGASDKPDRYSNQAVRLLKDHGHRVIPVHPRLTQIEGLPVVKELRSIGERVETLTMYVGEMRSTALSEDILALNPGRVIFNPGSENDGLERRLLQKGIPFVHGCTLVMLRSGTF